MATRTWIPSQGYDLEVSIAGRDYTKELESCVISYSLSTYYPIINLTLHVKLSDLITYKLYGQDHLKLTIRVLGADKSGTPAHEDVVYSLLILNSDFDMPMTEILDGDDTKTQPERTKINFITVPRDSFKIMSTVVNKIYLADTMKNIVQDLITTAGGTPKIDTNNIQLDTLDQIVCPPKSLIYTLRSLDNIYSIHNGSTTIFCDQEKYVYVKNLAYRINSTEAFIINQLSTNVDEEQTIEEDSIKSYMTYSPISTEYDANAKIAVIAKENNFIIKPKDSLYYIYTANASTWAEKYGLNSGNSELLNDVFLNDRKKYTMNDSAWPYSARNDFTKSSLIKTLASMSKISITLDRYFGLDLLLNIGEAFLLRTKSLRYKELSGKYILFSTDVSFKKKTDWMASANITGIRTNRLIGT